VCRGNIIEDTEPNHVNLRLDFLLIQGKQVS
jgi:hypothetical protein